MKSLVVYCSLLAAASAAAAAADLSRAWDLIQEEFNNYKLQHNKVYASEAEEQMRLQNFLHSRQQVALHNARYEQGLVSFTTGINKFSDMTHQEMVKTHHGLKTRWNADTDDDNANFVPPPDDVTVADEVDWREHGAVTPVGAQGNTCGSCWAFSATGSLEGQHYRKTGELVSLSEQNLIDCTTSYSSGGCNGGIPEDAFRYVKYNGGINTDADYPYEGQNNWCSYNASKSAAQDVGFVTIPVDEEMLKLAVATVGPISVFLDASSMWPYEQGIYYDSECSSEKLDHDVLVVGYGTDENNEDYWLIKNSWGTNWGMDGYMRLARNRDNHCGVASSAIYPLV